MIVHLSDLDAQWLIKTHFFGIYKSDPDGTLYLPNPSDPTQRLETSVLNDAIDAAIDRLEMTLGGAKIRKLEYTDEFHDYDVDLFNNYMQMSLYHYPVYQVDSVKIVYGEHGQDIWDVPADLIQTQGTESLFGTIEVLPFKAVPSANIYDPALIPFVSSSFGVPYAPSMMKVVYHSGMDGLAGGLDASIVRAIGLFAAIHPFNILGDIVIGAGIASSSLSFDGISRSVNTTASAENSAFSSRIIMHRKELFGEQGVPGLIQNLQTKWRRVGLSLL